MTGAATIVAVLAERPDGQASSSEVKCCGAPRTRLSDGASGRITPGLARLHRGWFTGLPQFPAHDRWPRRNRCVSGSTLRGARWARWRTARRGRDSLFVLARLHDADELGGVEADGVRNVDELDDIKPAFPALVLGDERLGLVQTCRRQLLGCDRPPAASASGDSAAGNPGYRPVSLRDGVIPFWATPAVLLWNSEIDRGRGGVRSLAMSAIR